MIGTGLICLLSGCGFHPLYGGPGGGGEANALLQRVEVALIPDRPGQLLRQALQARLQRSAGAPPAFLLDAKFGISEEALAVTQDSSVRRIRAVALSRFVLTSLDGGRPTCASGRVRLVDGFDVQNQQFFASDLASEAVSRRLADAVAQEIVTRLALALGQSRAPGCDVSAL